jgi:hypothetical protein
MADRQNVPTHDPIGDLLGRITAIDQRLAAVAQALELLNIAPLRLEVTLRNAGSPPTYLVELVNPASGGRVTLADNL